MISLDTNVLVRLLVNDHKEQSQIKIAKDLLIKYGQAYLTQIVQVELVWVLEIAYGFNKKDIISALEHLISHPVYQLQNLNSFISALDYYKNNNADFSDYLILSESTNNQYELATFDRKLGNSTNAQLL